MLDKLNNIANKLDELGLYRQATTTTNIMKKIADNSMDFEYDDNEFDMVKNQLVKAKNAIINIEKMIEGNEGRLEDWLQSKITLAVDYLGVVADYLMGERQKVASKNEGKKLNKPFRTPGGPKKFSVYVKNDKGNTIKVNFGDPNMRIKDNIPGRRKNFRARHNCENPGPKTKARYWSCRQWSDSKSDI
jgi:hypothetical protein